MVIFNDNHQKICFNSSNPHVISTTIKTILHRQPNTVISKQIYNLKIDILSKFSKDVKYYILNPTINSKTRSISCSNMFSSNSFQHISQFHYFFHNPNETTTQQFYNHIIIVSTLQIAILRIFRLRDRHPCINFENFTQDTPANLIIMESIPFLLPNNEVHPIFSSQTIIHIQCI